MYKFWLLCWLIGRLCIRYSEYFFGWVDCTEGNCILIYSVVV